MRYPLVIFDPHGDYLGLFEKRHLFENSDIKIFYPRITVTEDNVPVIIDMVTKMGAKLTDPQQHLFYYLVGRLTPRLRNDCSAVQFLQDLADVANQQRVPKDEKPEEIQDIKDQTIGAVVRNLNLVRQRLEQMERNNERLRNTLKAYKFEEMPDPSNAPEKIVSPGQVSIFYLAGYDHLTQSTIVSIVLEHLFSHRATLSNEIPPFQAVIEEAHNFIPSRAEGRDSTPSLPTIRKVITEGRKFGTGLLIISQRPSRLDETTLAQCNSFLVLRLVNPKDKSFVRSVMENLSDSDANILQTFGPGQGLVSGQAVKFPLLVKVKFDEDLVSEAIGDEDFIDAAAAWEPSENQVARSKAEEFVDDIKGVDQPDQDTSSRRRRRKLRPGKRG